MKRILWILLIGVVVGCIIVYLLYGLRPEPQLEQKDEGRLRQLSICNHTTISPRKKLSD